MFAGALLLVCAASCARTGNNTSLAPRQGAIADRETSDASENWSAVETAHAFHPYRRASGQTKITSGGNVRTVKVSPRVSEPSSTSQKQQNDRYDERMTAFLRRTFLADVDMNQAEVREAVRKYERAVERAQLSAEVRVPSPAIAASSRVFDDSRDWPIRTRGVLVGYGGRSLVWLGTWNDSVPVAVRHAALETQAAVHSLAYEAEVGAAVCDWTHLARLRDVRGILREMRAEAAYDFVGLDVTALPDYQALWLSGRFASGAGVDLQVLHRFGFFSLPRLHDRLADLAGQMLLALDHLHEVAHAVHRDFKIENIFASNGDYPFGIRYVLGDYGYAVPMDGRGRGVPRPDGFYDFVGTAGYVAPESRSRREYSRASDVWALGRVVMDLLPGGMISQTEDGDCVLERLARLSLGDDAHLRSFLEDTLAVEPRDRKSVRELLAHPFIARLAKSGGAYVGADLRVADVENNEARGDSIGSAVCARNDAPSNQSTASASASVTPDIIQAESPQPQAGRDLSQVVDELHASNAAGRRRQRTGVLASLSHMASAAGSGLRRLSSMAGAGRRNNRRAVGVAPAQEVLVA